MAKTIRVESLERQERVQKFVLEHMEEKCSFPSARAIQSKFFENQYPGNLNSISSDLKDIAQDISQVVKQKRLIDVDGEQAEIPREAFEFAVKSYQAIELQQRKKFDQFKSDAMKDVTKSNHNLNAAKNKITLLESDLKNKVEALQFRDVQAKELKDSLNSWETKFQDLQTHFTAQQRTNQTLEHEYQSQLKTNQNLETKISDITKELNKFDSECKQLNSEKIGLVNDIDKLTVTKNILSSERSAQFQQISELRDVINALNKKIISFEDHLFKISNNNVSFKNIDK